MTETRLSSLSLRCHPSLTRLSLNNMTVPTYPDALGQKAALRELYLCKVIGLAGILQSASAYLPGLTLLKLSRCVIEADCHRPSTFFCSEGSLKLEDLSQSFQEGREPCLCKARMKDSAMLMLDKSPSIACHCFIASTLQPTYCQSISRLPKPRAGNMRAPTETVLQGLDNRGFPCKLQPPGWPISARWSVSSVDVVEETFHTYGNLLLPGLTKVELNGWRITNSLAVAERPFPWPHVKDLVLDRCPGVAELVLKPAAFTSLERLCLWEEESEKDLTAFASASEDPESEIYSRVEASRQLKDTLLSLPSLVQLSGKGRFFALADKEGIYGWQKGQEEHCLQPYHTNPPYSPQTGEVWIRLI